MAKWFYVKGYERQGPVDLDTLIDVFRSGEIPEDALVWHQGLEEWTEADAVPELQERLSPPSQPAAAEPVEEPAPAEDLVSIAEPAPAEEPPPTVALDAPASAQEEPGGASELESLVANPFIEGLRKAYKLNKRVFAQLAEELRKEGELEEAIRLCREGLQEFPSYGIARFTLGRALMEVGDLEGGRTALEQLWQESPSNTGAARALGDCLEQLGDVEGARRVYRATVALKPGEESILERLAQLGEGPPEPAQEEETLSPGEPAADEAAEPPAEVPAVELEPEVAEQPALAASAEELDETVRPLYDELPAPTRAPDEDLPPIPLVEAEESFALENPYDIPSVWKQPGEQDDLELSELGSSAGGAQPLKENELPELIQDLSDKQWTGILELALKGVVKSLRLEDGRLVYAWSTSKDDRLGELLLREGRITVRQFTEAGKAIKSGTRVGTALVEQGVLEAEELASVLSHQSLEIICSVFQWTEGTYRLNEGSAAGGGNVTLDLSTADVIQEGIGRIKTWSRIERGIGGMEAQYQRASDYERIVAQMSLPAEKLEIATADEGVRDVETICQQSKLSHFETCNTLWAFRVIGVMQRIA